MSKYQGESGYTYPGTDVLVNKLDIRDAAKLEIADRIFSLYRLGKLEESPLPGAFDVSHLKAIHYFLFQDLYSFAGEFRKEGITKANSIFPPPAFIEQEAARIMEELKKENRLKGIEKAEFCSRAAYYMSEINALHPFREGNGRVQREFIRTLGVEVGYRIDWSKAEPDEILHSSITSFHSSNDELVAMLKKCISKV
jgi:cell filamentation protein